MDFDKDFERAAAQGRRNRETVGLIQNWCAHARVERFGGVGMIEQATGDPIGHFGLACDHAGRSGMSCWDLADAALDFHDRYCADCAVRKAVGLPNLSKLLAEREQRRSEREALRLAAESEAQQQLAERRRSRDILRAGLSAVSSAIVDDIDLYDADRSDENFERLIKSAALAPEHFPSQLVDYLFEIGEQEEAIRAAALAMLANVANDRARLACLAFNALPAAYDVAADVLMKSIDVIDATMIGQRLPLIVDRANPDLSQSFGRERAAEPELLIALWRAFPTEVVRGLEAQLSTRARYRVELGARGFKVLQGVKPDVANPSARALVATFVRAHLLIDDLDRRHERLARLNEVIATIFGTDPEGMDALLQSFLLGADKAIKARVFQVYSEVVRRGEARRAGSAPSAAEQIAFRRLLWAPTTETDDEVLRVAQEVFRHHARGLDPFAKGEIDGLLGAALLLDDQLAAVDQDRESNSDDMLKAMQRMARRSMLSGLISSYLELASRASVDDPALMDQVLAMVEALPEARERLKGEMLGALAQLAASVDGLTRFLPHLYYGLVGSSVYVRSCAATALSEIPHSNRKNIPPLVFEAFCVLLSDQYVAVHKAAVRALDRFSLPEVHKQEAAYAVFQVLMAHRHSEDHDFIITCIERLARWMDVFDTNVETLKTLLIDVAMTIEPIHLRSHMISLAHALGTHERFTLLLARMLPEFSDRYNRDDELRRLLWMLPDEHIRAHADRLVEAARGLIQDDPWAVYEVLDRIGMSGAELPARQLADACVDDFDDTVRNLHLRSTGRFMALAHAFEGAVGTGDRTEQAKLSEAWIRNAEILEQHKAELRERDSRADLPFQD